MVAILLSAVSGPRDCLLKLSNHLMSFDDMEELKRISRILLKNLSTQWNLKWAKNVNNIENINISELIYDSDEEDSDEEFLKG